MTTEKQRRAYSAVELAHNDHRVLDKRHYNAPKDEYGDPEGI